MLNELTDHIEKNYPGFGLTEKQAGTLSFFKVGGNPWSEGRVNFLIFTSNEPEPILFARVIRDRSREEALWNEYTLMKTLGSHPAIAPFLPLPIIWVRLSHYNVLLQPVCHGQRILTAMGKSPFISLGAARIEKHFHRARQFVSILNADMRSPLVREDFQQRFSEPLKAFYREFMPSGARLAALDTLLHNLERTCPQDLFLTPLHGDYSATNVFIEATEEMKVVDWETGNLEGLPCWDLFYFITKYIHNLKVLPHNRWKRVLKAYTSVGILPSLIQRQVEDYCETIKLSLDTARLLLPLHFLYKASLKKTMRSREAAQPWIELFEGAMDGMNRLCF